MFLRATNRMAFTSPLLYCARKKLELQSKQNKMQVIMYEVFKKVGKKLTEIFQNREKVVKKFQKCHKILKKAGKLS